MDEHQKIMYLRQTRDYSMYDPNVQRCERRCYSDNSGKCYVPASRQIGGIWTCGNHEQDKPKKENSEVYDD